MAVFPSLDWFSQVREIYNSDSSFHSGGGGACDTTAAFKVGGQEYIIVFEGLKCADIHPATDDELQRCDFIIEMSDALWQSMVANVQQHGRADGSYTLNSIDLQQDQSIAFSPVDDQYKQDLFYRYNQNFQDFFNASSRVPTTFA